MVLNNIKNRQKGFTIVELLVVIVVIGILAAITIVSYTGVTARANKSSAQSAAANLVKKIEIYNAELTYYPNTLSVLTGAASDKSYYVASGTVTYDALAAQPTKPSYLRTDLCGTLTGGAAAANLAAVQGGVKTGMNVYYWDYSATTPVATALSTGTVSGGNVTCYPTAG